MYKKNPSTAEKTFAVRPHRQRVLQMPCGPLLKWATKLPCFRRLNCEPHHSPKIVVFQLKTMDFVVTYHCFSDDRTITCFNKYFPSSLPWGAGLWMHLPKQVQNELNFWDSLWHFLAYPWIIHSKLIQIIQFSWVAGIFVQGLTPGIGLSLGQDGSTTHYRGALMPSKHTIYKSLV